MEYRLNTFSEQYSEEQDITTIESICNYYGTLLKYLDVMLRTDNPTIFYMALNRFCIHFVKSLFKQNYYSFIFLVTIFFNFEFPFLLLLVLLLLSSLINKFIVTLS